jgi:hypothetical protein
MSHQGRDELQKFAQTILGAFLVSARREDLAEEAKAFLASDRCAELANQFLGTLVHPLTDLLVSEALSRTLLPNYFNFLHLVLGDLQDALTRQCEEIIEDVRKDPHFTWDFFYDDPRAKAVLWGVLMRIVEAFKRFEPRRDWFIGLMQNRMHAVSIASNAFVPLAHSEEDNKVTFDKTQFDLLFGALFRPLLRLSAQDDAAFIRQFGAPPARLIKPLVEKLI